MGWTAEAFRENMNLEHHISMKAFLFILKAVSAIAYIFVLGYIAAGGMIDGAVKLVLLLGFVFDMVPDLMTLRTVGYFPSRAKHLEYVQYLMATFAYCILLITLFVAGPAELLIGYSAFAILWIISFLLQEGILFLLTPETPEQTL